MAFFSTFESRNLCDFRRFGLILPMFVGYYSEIPKVGSGSFTISTKILAYIAGLNLAGGSTENMTMAIASIVRT